MFTRTFDLMFDSMTIHVQTHFARAVVAWCVSTPEPPPLNLLQVPFQIISLLRSPMHQRPSLRRINSGQPQQCAVSQIGVGLSVATPPPSPPPSPASSASPTINGGAAVAPVVGAINEDINPVSRRRRSLKDGLAPLLLQHETFSGMDLQHEIIWLLTGEPDTSQDLHEYAGTTVKSLLGHLNSWELWKEKMTEADLVQEVSNFIAKHEDVLVQEERWRTKMMRRLGDKFEHVDSRFDKMNERFERRFEQLSSSCMEIKDSLHSLNSKLAPQHRGQPQQL